MEPHPSGTPPATVQNPRAHSPSGLEKFRRGETMLPEDNLISPGSLSFQEILTEELPEGKGEKLLLAMNARQERLPRIAHCLLALLALAILLAAYLLWPRPAYILNTIGIYDISCSRRNVSSQWKSLYKDAYAFYQKGEFSKARETMAPHLEEIWKDSPSFQGNDAIAFLYLDSCRKSLREGTVDASILDLARKADQFDSDNLVWRCFHLYFLWHPYQSLWKDDSGALLRATARPSLADQASSQQRERARSRLLDAFANIQKEAKDICRLNKQKTSSQNPLPPATIRTIDKIRCEALVAMWRLEGGESLPDDKDDPGVVYREEAYRIAKEHYLHANNDDDFRRIMLFIAETIREHMTSFFHGPYFFDGNTHVYKSDLDNAIRLLRETPGAQRERPL